MKKIDCTPFQFDLRFFRLLIITFTPIRATNPNTNGIKSNPGVVTVGVVLLLLGAD